jgi:hypothetical protein
MARFALRTESFKVNVQLPLSSFHFIFHTQEIFKSSSNMDPEAVDLRVLLFSLEDSGYLSGVMFFTDGRMVEKLCLQMRPFEVLTAFDWGFIGQKRAESPCFR